MKAQILATVMATSLVVVASLGNAAVPANAPAGTTGLCNDGSYYTGGTKKGACKGHKGIKEWYAEPAAAAKSEVPAAKATAPATKTGAAIPPGSTGLCNDGTYYTGATKKGACKGHKGVKEWYAAPNDAMAANTKSSGAPASTASPAAPAASATNTPAPTGTPNSGNSSAPTAPTKNAAPQVATAPAGSVWINKATKVYHCPGDRWYGKTKEGEYMAEAQATAMGFKPDHGKPCK